MELSLYPEAEPCVGSGMCCKISPCPFGKWNENKTACEHLEEISENDREFKRYTCGIAEQIIGQPGWEIAPAFGAGCCSSLFNSNRRNIIGENERTTGDSFSNPPRSV